MVKVPTKNKYKAVIVGATPEQELELKEACDELTKWLDDFPALGRLKCKERIALTKVMEKLSKD